MNNLTPADDYPLHQTAEPIAFAGADRNFYDRFFFNGYDAGQDVFFAAALGVYPQLNVMDAAVCLSLDGTQYNLRASKDMKMDRLNLQVGPIRITLAQPLARTLIEVADNPHGLSGHLEARARHPAIEEPRFTRRIGPRGFMDYTRLTQNISWQGSLTLKGRKIDLTGFQGTRDRSWGVRPVGAADPQPPSREMQFYWLWTPANFAGHALFCHSNDDAQGAAWNRRAVLADLARGAQQQTHFRRVALSPAYQSGTRRIESLGLELREGDQRIEAQMEATGRLFYMSGLGYTHPHWSHGLDHGALEVGFDEMELDKAEAQLRSGTMHHLHVQALSRVALMRGGERYEGSGVIEQLFIGPHAPSGFAGLLDRITD